VAREITEKLLELAVAEAIGKRVALAQAAAQRAKAVSGR
jgi:hypothetical protein